MSVILKHKLCNLLTVLLTCKFIKLNLNIKRVQIVFILIITSKAKVKKCFQNPHRMSYAQQDIGRDLPTVFMGGDPYVTTAQYEIINKIYRPYIRSTNGINKLIYSV